VKVDFSDLAGFKNLPVYDYYRVITNRCTPVLSLLFTLMK
jgi:hypothetical protein